MSLANNFKNLRILAMVSLFFVYIIDSSAQVPETNSGAPAPSTALVIVSSNIPGLPSPPSADELVVRRPKCPEYRITRTHRHLMEQCRALWEDYLQITVEGYRRSFAPYVKALNKCDKKLQLKIPKELTQEQYEEYKSTISDEILDATSKNGRYMLLYLEYVDVYRRQVELLMRQYKQAGSGIG